MILVFPNAPLGELSAYDAREETLIGWFALKAVVQRLQKASLAHDLITRTTKRFIGQLGAVLGSQVTGKGFIVLLVVVCDCCPFLLQTIQGQDRYEAAAVASQAAALNAKCGTECGARLSCYLQGADESSGFQRAHLVALLQL